MKLRLLLTSLCLTLNFASANTENENANPLLNAINAHISNKFGTVPAQVKIRPLDRRLSVPDCSAGLTIKFEKNRRDLIKASCEALNWQIYVPVKITKWTDVHIFAADFSAGALIRYHNLLPQIRLLEQSENIDIPQKKGRYISLRDINRGDVLFSGILDEAVDTYLLKSNIAEGHQFAESDILVVPKAKSRTPISQIFPASSLLGSVASRAMLGGQNLSRSDFRQPTTVVIATRGIRYRALVNELNTRSEVTHKKVPKDAVIDLKSLGLIQAVRTLKPGDIVRRSDIRPAPAVQKGEVVTAEIKRGNLVLTSTLIAQENGLIGDLIRLSNPESGEIVRAKITGVRTVSLR